MIGRSMADLSDFATVCVRSVPVCGFCATTLVSGSGAVGFWVPTQ